MIVQGHEIEGKRSLRTHTVVVGSGSGGGVAAFQAWRRAAWEMC